MAITDKTASRVPTTIGCRTGMMATCQEQAQQDALDDVEKMNTHLDDVKKMNTHHSKVAHYDNTTASMLSNAARRAHADVGHGSSCARLDAASSSSSSRHPIAPGQCSTSSPSNTAQDERQI